LDIKEQSTEHISLANGYHLEINREGRDVTFLSDAGKHMKIILSPEGPIIEMDAPRVVFRNTGDLALEANSIEMKSRGELKLDVGGNCTQRIAGNLEIDVRDDIHMKAQAGSMEAVRGGLSFSATDDLDLKGLRVLHNVPTEEEVMEQLQKVKTFGEYMKCPAYDPNSPRKLPASDPVEREGW